MHTSYVPESDVTEILKAKTKYSRPWLPTVHCRDPMPLSLVVLLFLHELLQGTHEHFLLFSQLHVCLPWKDRFEQRLEQGVVLTKNIQ